ncbi:MAG: insulinase family protein [Gemmatimonadales bacterium]|nr:insulinase family protein [Gemmatimonadales bacterium]
MPRIMTLTPTLAWLLVLLPAICLGQTYLDLENQIQEFTLDNGVHFIVLENHDVPVFSFQTLIDVGSANETRGITGISHILEHMAFKGTNDIGGNNKNMERKAMAAEDEAFEAFKHARLVLVPKIEVAQVKLDRKTRGLPAERQEFFQKVSSAMHGTGAEIAVKDGQVIIAHDLGTEEEKIDNFDLNADEIELVNFFMSEIKPLEEEFAAREQDFEDAKDAAREFVVTNEFGQVVEENGGNGMNAGTGTDLTMYHYNFPSNRLELWAYLEGNRMSDPVLREFYTEKDGPVTEERRSRTDNNPMGRLLEIFQNQMFMANGYHHSTIGYMSDIQNISRADCQAYFKKHYHGGNMVVALVGDIYLEDVKKYAKKYFSDIPAGQPSMIETFEPKQLVEKRLIMTDPAQPLFAVGYHIENGMHPDWPVYEVIADVLGQGRTSRLNKSLVKEQNIAVFAQSFAGYPGDKYQTSLLAFAIPVKGKTGYDLEKAIYEEIDRIVEEGITTDELSAVKQRTRANFIRGLRSNSGMAGQLAGFQTSTGNWRNLFHQVEEIDSVTLDDVKRVAAEIFVKSNRTVAIIETEEDS